MTLDALTFAFLLAAIPLSLLLVNLWARRGTRGRRNALTRRLTAWPAREHEAEHANT